MCDYSLDYFLSDVWIASLHIWFIGLWFSINVSWHTTVPQIHRGHATSQNHWATLIFSTLEYFKTMAVRLNRLSDMVDCKVRGRRSVQVKRSHVYWNAFWLFLSLWEQTRASQVCDNHVYVYQHCDRPHQWFIQLRLSNYPAMVFSV